MFTITESDKFKYPVKFYTPKEDGTGRAEHTFTGIFRRMTVSQVEKELLTLRDDREFARKVMIGWADVVDDKGNQVEFKTDIFETLLDKVGFATAVAAAFTEALEVGARKN